VRLAKPAEIRQLLHGGLNPQRSAELIDEMRAAGLPLVRGKPYSDGAFALTP
jgi:hypothetical protein